MQLMLTHGLHISLTENFNIQALLPKSAIIKDGDALLICYAFRQKRINVSALEYVSKNKLNKKRANGQRCLSFALLDFIKIGFLFLRSG